MGFFTLIIIAFGATFAVIWLLLYVPLVSTVGGKMFSPRLLVCRILAPADAAITLFLIVGAWTGLATTITGISMLVYNVLTGIGLSVGVLFVRKVLVPRWQIAFSREKESRKTIVINGYAT